MRDFEKTKDPEIFLRKPSGIYYYIGTPVRGSGSVTRSLQTKAFSQAQLEKRRLLVELRGLDPKATTILFSEVAEDILQTQSKKARATFISAKLHITYLNEFFRDVKISKIDEKSWENYKTWAEKKNPDRMLEHDRRHFIMIMRRAHDLGFTKRVIRVKKIRARAQKGKVLSDDEIKRILNEASPTLKTQILMALTMGMRRSEILHLTWDRVNLNRKAIHLRAEDTKIRRARDVPISAQVLERLLEIEERTEAGPVFPSRLDIAEVTKDNKTAWKACRRRAGVRCRFHDLRHTFLTKAFKQNVNPALICDFAGLSMSVAERVYLHFSIDDKAAIADLVKV